MKRGREAEGDRRGSAPSAGSLKPKLSWGRCVDMEVDTGHVCRHANKLVWDRHVEAKLLWERHVVVVVVVVVGETC